MTCPRKPHFPFLPLMSVMDRKHDDKLNGNQTRLPRWFLRSGSKLTETQFRRLWMYYIDGMTVDEIGRS